MNTEEMIEDIDDLRACILATVEAWLANQNTTVAYKKRTAVAAMTIALFEQAKTFGVQPTEFFKNFVALMQIHITDDTEDTTVH